MPSSVRQAVPVMLTVAELEPAAQRRRIGAIFVFGALCTTSLLCGPAIATELAASLGYSPSQIGLYFSIEFAGYFLAGLAGRWLLPAFDWRRIALVSALLFAGGSILTIFSLPWFALLVPVRLLTVTSSSMLATVCLATANESPMPSRAISILIMGQLVGGMLGLAVFPLLFSAFGLTSYFVTLAVLVLLALPLTRLISSRSQAVVGLGVSGAGGRNMRLLLRFPAVFLFYAALGGIWTFAGSLGKNVGLDPITCGTILSLATIAGIIGSGLAAAVPARIAAALPLGAGYAILIASGLGFIAADNVPLYVAAVFAFKFAWTFIVPFIFTVIGTFDSHGRMMAEGMLVTGLGLAAGPYAAGRLIEYYHGYGAMLAIETGLLVLGWISIAFLARAAAKTAQ